VLAKGLGPLRVPAPPAISRCQMEPSASPCCVGTPKEWCSAAEFLARTCSCQLFITIPAGSSERLRIGVRRNAFTV
jgi:hypothetical protein